MIGVLTLGLVAGLDNLLVGASLGLLPWQRSRRHMLAAAFAACELLAAMTGAAIGGALTLSGIAAALWMLVSGAVFVLVRQRRVHSGRNVWAVGLPLILSLDNLAAGVATESSGWASALLIGSISPMMACAGVYSGSLFRQAAPGRI